MNEIEADRFKRAKDTNEQQTWQIKSALLHIFRLSGF